jgi:hypothetical protein
MKWHHKVGERNFDNKLSAIRTSNLTNESISFNAPQEYADFDFSKEPTQDLDILLKQEAEKIRDTYRKVRIYYSGGSDSKLMLDTFIENKIDFDEVICLKSGISNADYEIDRYAIPHLKSLDIPSNKVKINVPTIESYGNYYKDGFESKIQKGMYTYTTHFRLIAQDELFDDRNFDPETANLRGFDKPKIVKVLDKWYTYFLDVDIETFPHTLNFFSDNPILQSKQAHLFQQAIGSVNESNIWSKQETWNKSTGRQNIIEKTLYHDRDDCFFDIDGYKTYYANLKEKEAIKWALENKLPSLPKWLTCLQQLKDYTNGTWWNKGHPELGTVGIFSKFYGITSNETKTVDDLFPDGFKIQ